MSALKLSPLLFLSAISLPVEASTIHYYRFEQTLTDEMGNTDGQGTGGSPIFSTNLFGAKVPLTGAANLTSLQLNGNYYVRFDDLFQFHKPGDATLEFWVYLQSDAHESIFWTRSDSEDKDRYNIFTNFAGSDFNIDPRVSTPGIFKPITIPNNLWTHLAIVRTGDTQYSLYRDGVLHDSVVHTTPLPTASGWTISGRNNFRFHGLLDEVRISDAALTPEQFLNYCPEPGSTILIAGGLAFLGLWRWRHIGTAWRR